MSPKPDEINRPSVPAVYCLFLLSVAASRGVSREQVLEGSGIARASLDTPQVRVTPVRYGRLVANALRLTQDRGLGYEMGLRSRLTKHGFLGYGLMSCATLREAIELSIKYLRLCSPFYSMHLSVAGPHAVVDVHEALPLGKLRPFAFDQILVELAMLYASLLGHGISGLELWFDYPEPEYYRRYRERLPRVRFARSANRLRFPAQHLEQKLTTANPMTARLVVQECERELALLGYTEDLLGRVRALLVNEQGSYPDLKTAAARLGVSERTLMRNLQRCGTRFMKLLDEARRRDTVRLLEDPTLPIEQIAQRVGYSDPANFTRAFRKWTGESPSTYRNRL